MNTNIDTRIRALIDMIDLAWEQNASEKARMLSYQLEDLEKQREQAERGSLLMASVC